METRPVVKAIVDATSLYLASRDAKVSIDYGRLMNYLNEEFGAEEFVICASVGDGPSFDNARAVLRSAQDIGWKTWVTMPKGGAKPSSTIAMIAAEIQASAMRDQDVLLMSGHSDLVPVVWRAVETHGVSVQVLSNAKGTARDLRSVPDGFFDVMEHMDQIKKTARERHR